MAVQKANIELSQLADKTRFRMETVVTEILNDLGEGALKRTPVDLGYLRASWFVSLDKPGSGPSQAEVDSERSKVRGVVPPVTAGRISLTLAGFKVGQTVYFLNNAEYAEHVEYGTSNMAPRAFVRKTVAAAPRIASRTIARLSVL